MQQEPLFLQKWEPFFRKCDYESLWDFMRRVKHVQGPQCLIIVGTGKNGKTTLLKEFSEWIGAQNYHTVLSDCVSEVRAVLILDETMCDLNQRQLNIIDTLLDYSVYIVSTTTTLDKINHSLRNYATVVHMDHVFV